MNWLITGGCGFIGTNLIRRLVAEGEHSLRIIDNLSVGDRDDLAAVCRFTELSASRFSSASLPPNADGRLAELVVGDILDEQLAMGAARGMDVIVHLAANTGVGPSVENPRSDCLVNVIGTLNYLEAARHNEVGRFVFASSGAPAGDCKPPIHEEVVPHPVSPYGASKLCGEAYCSAYHKTYGLKTVALRFANVYGPACRRKSSVVAKFIRQALKGEPLEVYGDGRQTRDFIYVEDLVEAILLAADHDHAGGEVFQIGTGSETTVEELINLILPLLEKAGHTDIRTFRSPRRAGEVQRNFADPAKAKRILGWQAQVALTAGLARTVQWFVKDPLGVP